jgi:hypothetical protein
MLQIPSLVLVMLKKVKTCVNDKKTMSIIKLLYEKNLLTYPPLPTSVQPISITKTLLIVPTKNERPRDPPLFTGKLLIKFQNILRNTTQVIIRHSDDFHFCCSRVIGLDMTENKIFTLCRMITWVVILRMFWNFISSLPVKRGGSLSFLVRTISNVLLKLSCDIG